MNKEATLPPLHLPTFLVELKEKGIEETLKFPCQAYEIRERCLILKFSERKTSIMPLENLDVINIETIYPKKKEKEGNDEP